MINSFFHFIRRQNSRASSVDRREIFEKYVQEGNEHSETIIPYSNDNPELIGNDQSISQGINDRNSEDSKIPTNDHKSHTIQPRQIENTSTTVSKQTQV